MDIWVTPVRGFSKRKADWRTIPGLPEKKILELNVCVFNVLQKLLIFRWKHITVALKYIRIFLFLLLLQKIWDMSDKEEKFIGIYDNFSGLPKFSREVSSVRKYHYPDLIIILLCIEGSATYTVGYREFNISENSFLAIASDIPFYNTARSENFRTHILSVRTDTFERIADGLVKIYSRKILMESPLHRIPPEKMKMCSDILGYVKTLQANAEENFFRNRIIKNYINILFFEACNIMLHEPGENRIKNRRKEELSGIFIKLLENHIHESRKVEFYADKMSLTPKYLSSVIKDTTGRNASSWINEFTVIEAGRLLRASTKTIQEISYELGFSTPSHFAKFYRDMSGMTPREARMKSGL